jgi:hypothetical protein
MGTLSQPVTEISISGGRAKQRPWRSLLSIRGAQLQNFIRLFAVREGPQQMLTAAQQYAIDQFAKGLLALDDDALIDTYHQALEDLRAARAEGSENLSKAYAQTFATEKAMRDRFHDYRARYKMRYP